MKRPESCLCQRNPERSVSGLLTASLQSATRLDSQNENPASAGIAYRNCDSTDIRRSRRYSIWPVRLILPLARCQECGHLFLVPFWSPLRDPIRPSKERRFDEPQQTFLNPDELLDRIFSGSSNEFRLRFTQPTSGQNRRLANLMRCGKTATEHRQHENRC